jgi:hypothetical protein
MAFRVSTGDNRGVRKKRPSLPVAPPTCSVVRVPQSQP